MWGLSVQGQLLVTVGIHTHTQVERERKGGRGRREREEGKAREGNDRKEEGQRVDKKVHARNVYAPVNQMRHGLSLITPAVEPVNSFSGLGYQGKSYKVGRGHTSRGNHNYNWH